MRRFVSRAGEKLDHALATFGVDVSGFVCADFGANAGGFTDCLLQGGAAKVYAIDTGYGALEWKLRKDPRVVAMERTNAMHATFPEAMDLVTIDVAWTKQRHILPAAQRVLKPGRHVVTLIKPHYEANPELLFRGVLPKENLEAVIDSVKRKISECGFEVVATVPSPILGAKGNSEMLALLRRSGSGTAEGAPGVGAIGRDQQVVD
jgi:23S rRNA (cytidine1920-2'-O)/16S rRNA (cytidine1409-2'-O)-methyltransferase